MPSNTGHLWLAQTITSHCTALRGITHALDGATWRISSLPHAPRHGANARATTRPAVHRVQKRRAYCPTARLPGCPAARFRHGNSCNRKNHRNLNYGLITHSQSKTRIHNKTLNQTARFRQKQFSEY
ncbi:hypothetical protein HUS70_09735 [Pandoraea nosoerga]|uniref:hypothetical protein n=1 Tax=Pandoraea nosoerga TaxID=2508296 RepID=UPI0012428A47|nr:hypothetical protein [Pandoraea nosoerga]MBN4666895.1 hypothetical protein [Pandoraea nosoerga]MBN4677026.1 hypothetical protein [Pandoraea nosoerga]MBN4681695.1 hypothetical protein [Pandoraea nosoerga]MBN4744921.1 hypothetical protein [Pandoraea nosoerga]